MPRRLLKVLPLAAIVAAVAMPASAGPFLTGYDVVQGVTVEGPVGIQGVGFGTATVQFLELQGGSMESSIQILPLPTAPDPATLEPAPATIGCITFRLGSLRDHGCDVINHYVNVDPAMQSGALSFSVKSAVFEGSELRTNLLLTGEGAPTPIMAGDDPAADPPYATIDVQFLLTRAGVTQGTVTSDGLGLGTPQGVVGAAFLEPDATMFSGLGVKLIHEPGCLVAVGLNCVVD